MVRIHCNSSVSTPGTREVWRCLPYDSIGHFSCRDRTTLPKDQVPGIVDANLLCRALREPCSSLEKRCVLHSYSSFSSDQFRCAWHIPIMAFSFGTGLPISIPIATPGAEFIICQWPKS